MGSELKYQIRLTLTPWAADAATEGNDARLAPLFAVLAKHGATIKSQYHAFAEYVAEAEREGKTDSPLYRWTRATIEDPAKKEKHLKSFTVYAMGQEVYAAAIADALEQDLRPMAGGDVVLRLARYDTNPANNPQAPKEYL